MGRNDRGVDAGSSLFIELDKLHNLRAIFLEGMLDKYWTILREYFSLRIKLTGSACITNYIHLIGAAHIYCFLVKYRNLYKYSQQGWEQLNKSASGIYHRHSQKGGHRAKEEEKSKILAVFRFFVRKCMWKTALGEEYFEQKE